MKIVAIGDSDIVEFEYGDVVWMISPLPYGIKKRLTQKSAECLSDNSKVADLIDVALDSVKYGLKGWKNLNYSDGKEATCELVKDNKGYECLSDSCVEMLFRTSAFDNLSKYCMSPDSIPEAFKKAIEFSNNVDPQPEPLGDDKKK